MIFNIIFDLGDCEQRVLEAHDGWVVFRLIFRAMDSVDFEERTQCHEIGEGDLLMPCQNVVTGDIGS